ncbi:MAG TPA: ATP-binding cassette domain-containing protein [Planctomycetota bacterium]|nr:ATP-binding cassette domain-containing protein [Planctomycetota bacterium]
MIDVAGLCKFFIAADGREVRAVDGLSLQCHPGEVFGLLGPNGAGKSTTLRILSTLLSPTAGSVKIAGFDPATEPLEVRRRLGYVTATTGLYERLTPREILRYFGELHGLPADRLTQRIEDLRQWLDLTEFFDRQCRTLSTGQKQRTSIARILVHDPPILILDEPTLGLDVLSNRVVLAFIAECAKAGKTVVMSTHYLDDAEALCKRFCLIHQGRSIGQGTLEELRAQCAPAGCTRLSEIFLHLTGGGGETILPALPSLHGRPAADTPADSADTPSLPTSKPEQLAP